MEVCRHGEYPAGSLVHDVAGNLYGTATNGGLANYGTVFELIPNADRRRWKAITLHNFCIRGNCPDGEEPLSGLTYSGQASGMTYDGKSPLYGTTGYGGSKDEGVAFEIRRSGGKWVESVIYEFCSQAGCADGSNPTCALIMDGSGNLYGTAPAGGTNGAGVIFELTPGPPGHVWTETVLYNPATDKGTYGALLMDKSGNLYDAGAGGDHDGGVIFELVRNGTNFNYTVIHSFCTIYKRRNCLDGGGPEAPLVMDASGNLFGVTGGGGIADDGTAFELSPHGGLWFFSMLYSFCILPECVDGKWPLAAPIIDAAGNLYGTTQYGGQDIAGTVYELTPP
jgi:uncharacterized repeat protein (TIGR03803 family)